jgi:hypothetical protein
VASARGIQRSIAAPLGCRRSLSSTSISAHDDNRPAGLQRRKAVRVALKLADARHRLPSRLRAGPQSRPAEPPASLSNLDELLRAAPDVRAELAQARAGIEAPFTWYQYDILGNLGHLDGLLHGEHRDLGRLAAGLPVADIGAADGDLAFALERVFGWQVDIVDNAATNQNGLLAARALRTTLGSGADIVDVDLDTQFSLPRQRYGLVLFLGILYHLQNPYYALRQLAERADHCLLSTKVARFAGADATDVAALPIAYLVNPTETNNDPTNYWIFSPAGLERLVARAGWTVLERLHVGDVVASDPSSPEHDERAFMLLRSARWA